MSPSHEHKRWGTPPWRIDFTPPEQPLPRDADFAVIGAGFTGLAAAAWLRLLAPEKSVVVLDSGHIGAGASGRTGGMVLAETAAGDFPGLGDVLAGLQDILRRLNVDCDLSLPGAWEIARSERAEKSDNAHAPRGKSPIEWQDSGKLRVVGVVPGGTLDPGKLVSGLARASHRLGATIVENQRVERIEWRDTAELHLANARLRAGKVLLATNALSLSLAGLDDHMHPRLTLAASTEPLSDDQFAAIGLSRHTPFYTVDFPYLWGRVCRDNSVVWGAGLVSPSGSHDLEQIDIAAAEPARMFASLEQRVHHLHPVLEKISFTYRWGGPILFRDNWTPVFAPHPASPLGIVLGAYAGHGVALSVYFGVWAAEAMLGRRSLPEWGRI
jgi:glycine/D-amino acid oxidase-like deaminating enzyme